MVVVVVVVVVALAPSRHMAKHWAPDPAVFLSEVNITLSPFLAALPFRVTGLGVVSPQKLKEILFYEKAFNRFV